MKDRAKHLETILVIATGMTFFHFVFKKDEFLYVALGVSIISIILPIAAKYIFLAWMGLAKVLGFINSHILLGLVFYAFLTPLALIRKIFSRKDPLQLKKKTGSYYETRDHEYSASDLENPF